MSNFFGLSNYGLGTDTPATVVDVPTLSVEDDRSERFADALIHAMSCQTFPQNFSIFGMVLGAGFTGGLSYLVAKHIFKRDDPGKWALYLGGGNAVLYTVQKVITHLFRA